MAMVSGMVGHSGRFGCLLVLVVFLLASEIAMELYLRCQTQRHHVIGCDHDDVTFRDLKRYQQGVLGTT